MPALLPYELPVRVEVRHHWIILFRRPGLVFGIALLLLLILSITDPWPMLLVLLVVLVLAGFVRWQTWDAERIILTQIRIVRVRGVPETTKTEASLRLDRISGAVMEQSVAGKILGFATIELEAAGDHPDLRHLVNIEHPDEFYRVLRHVLFGIPYGPDPSLPTSDRPLGPTVRPLGADPNVNYPDDDYPTAKFPPIRDTGSTS